MNERKHDSVQRIIFESKGPIAMDAPPSDHSQRLHDLHGALSNFNAILKLIKSGYRFDDEDAPGVLAQLEKAAACLKTEIQTLEREWKPTTR